MALPGNVESQQFAEGLAKSLYWRSTEYRECCTWCRSCLSL